MEITFGSLFTGVGGFDLGFERAGWQCAWQVEINSHCRRVLERHWPKVRKHDDVKTWPQGETKRVDAIIGGDPCQQNSNAGSVYKRTGEDFAGHFLRIVDALRPRIVVRENPSIITPDAPWPWYRFRSELERIGYAVLPFRLRACCLGADHKRDRLFLLAELPNTNSKRLEGVNWQRVAAGNNGGTLGGQVRSAGSDLLPAPRVCGSRNGIPNLMDRIKSAGNAVDVRVAEYIGRLVIEAIQEVG